MLAFWICVIIVSVLMEIVTTSTLISIWFALGAIVALLLQMLGLGFVIQVVCFFAISIACMIMVRPLAATYLRGNIVATNADRVIHETGVVTQSIPDNGWGEVVVSHVIWSAVSKDGKEIEKGSKVKILAIEGAKVIVQKY